MQIISVFAVVPPGFEPGQTAPKTGVLPLHHRTILVITLKFFAKIRHYFFTDKFFLFFLIFYCKNIKK